MSRHNTNCCDGFTSAHPSTLLIGLRFCFAIVAFLQFPPRHRLPRHERPRRRQVGELSACGAALGSVAGEAIWRA